MALDKEVSGGLGDSEGADSDSSTDSESSTETSGASGYERARDQITDSDSTETSDTTTSGTESSDPMEEAVDRLKEERDTSDATETETDTGTGTGSDTASMAGSGPGGQARIGSGGEVLGGDAAERASDSDILNHDTTGTGVDAGRKGAQRYKESLGDNRTDASARDIPELSGSESDVPAFSDADINSVSDAEAYMEDAKPDLQRGRDYTITQSNDTIRVEYTQAGRNRVAESQLARQLGVTTLDIDVTGDGTVQATTEAGAKALAESELASRGVENVDYTEVAPGIVRASGVTDEAMSGEVRPDAARSQSVTVATTAGLGLAEDLSQLGDVHSASLASQQFAAGVEAGQEQRRQQRAVAEDIVGTRHALPENRRREDRKQRAADSLSKQLGFDVTADDVTLTQTDEGYDVELSDSAQRAAALSTSAEFLRRDAEIERTNQGYRVNLPGENNAAIEEALTRRVQSGEAFGGETKVSAFGHTLNIDQATEDFAGAVSAGASAAGDFADRANLFNPNRAAFLPDSGQSVTGATTPAEASENLIINSLEGSVTPIGEAPKAALEAGETLTDPLAYQVAGEVGMKGARHLDDLTIKNALEAGEGSAKTLARLDAAAQENPKAAAEVGAGLLGAGIATVATGIGGSAALSKLATWSPRAARIGEFALDPVRVSAETVSDGASTARRAASDADIDIGDRIALSQFRSDERAMAGLTGKQLPGGKSDSNDDGDLGVPDDPWRVSDKRLYDSNREFGDLDSVTRHVDPTERSGAAKQDIGGGIAGTAREDSPLYDDDFTWDIGDSAAVRREAESPNVGSATEDIGGLIRTARREGVGGDAWTSGLLSLDFETKALLSQAVSSEAETTGPSVEFGGRAEFETETGVDETTGVDSATDTRASFDTETAMGTQFGRQTTKEWEATTATPTPEGTNTPREFTGGGSGGDGRGRRSDWPDFGSEDTATGGDERQPPADAGGVAFDNVPGAGWLNVYMTALAGGGLEARQTASNVDEFVGEGGLGLPTEGQVSPSDDLEEGLTDVNALFFLDDEGESGGFFDSLGSSESAQSGGGDEWGLL